MDSNRSRASSGTTVTLTVQPDNGYELDELTVTDKNGNGLKLTKKSDTAQVLFNLEGRQTVNYAMSFGDVKGSEWFAEAVRWAASEKIVSGYDNAPTIPPPVSSWRSFCSAMLSTRVWIR